MSGRWAHMRLGGTLKNPKFRAGIEICVSKFADEKNEILGWAKDHSTVTRVGFSCHMRHGCVPYRSRIFRTLSLIILACGCDAPVGWHAPSALSTDLTQRTRSAILHANPPARRTSNTATPPTQVAAHCRGRAIKYSYVLPQFAFTTSLAHQPRDPTVRPTRCRSSHR